MEWSDVERLLREQLAESSQEVWKNAGGPALYVVAEKILGPSESLVESWAVSGTTGYEFLNEVNGLSVDGRGRAALDRLYRDLVEDDRSFSDVVYQSKKLILQVSLSSELHMLTAQLDPLAESSRRSRDYTFKPCAPALSELIACFPVYRSYIDDHGGSESDRRYIEQGLRRARARNPLSAGGCSDSSGTFCWLRSPVSSIEGIGGGLRESSSRSLRLSPPRAWRTRPFMSTTDWSRSMRSAVTRLASARRRISFIASARCGRIVGRWRYRRFRRTTRSGVKMCVHGSTCFRRFHRNGLRGSSVGEAGTPVIG